MRRLWLIFSQAATVAMAVLFVVTTLKPEWLGREARTSIVPETVSVRAQERLIVSSYALAVAGRGLEA